MTAPTPSSREHGPLVEHADVVPGPRFAERIDADEHLLLWAFRGAASVRCGDAVHGLHTGELIWIPAGARHELDAGPGTLIFPIAVPVANIVDPPAEAVVHVLGPDWEDWMLHHFAAFVSPLRSPGYHSSQLVDQLEQRSESPVLLPPLPRSAAAREVAAALHRNPALRLTADQWAAAAGIGVRTLRRAFVEETGFTFSAWRLAWRLHAAAEYLHAGHDVGWVADQVGFRSVSGFIRSFSGQYGTTPSAWARRAMAGADMRPFGSRVRLSRDHLTLTSRLDTQGASPATYVAPPVPATFAAPRTYAAEHVILWVYKGRVRVWVHDRTHTLGRGEAIWMPAGFTHAVEVDTGSIALPMSFRASEVDVSLDDVAVVPIPARLDHVVMHNVIANCTGVRPAAYRRLAIIELFGEYAARQRELVLSMPTTPAARAVAQRLNRQPGDARSVRDWADELGVDAESLNRAFRDETGKTFAAWRKAARLAAARRLLRAGTPAAVTARRVGYLHPSAFSRDFRRGHGVSPRTYQRQVAHDS